MRISDWSSDVCSSDLTVGRVEQLPEKGSFFTKTIEIWNAPIVVTRGSDDRIQAFYNVCAHRGNQVVLTERGRASRFSCNYHNWVYRNDGSLMGVPDEANFFALDKKKCGRSEEHTSELQSLMRISYAVFCLKNKNGIRLQK